VLFGAFLASCNEPVEIQAEVVTRVDQELLFNNHVRDEEAACSCSADICPR
jgi:hypothetical protein